MLHGQLKHSHNVISFLDRVNDRDDLRFSGSKFQRWLTLYRIQSISVRGRYLSFENIKLSCTIFALVENIFAHFS